MSAAYLTMSHRELDRVADAATGIDEPAVVNSSR
jgi:hypothetical protein